MKRRAFFKVSGLDSFSPSVCSFKKNSYWLKFIMVSIWRIQKDKICRFLFIKFFHAIFKNVKSLHLLRLVGSSDHLYELIINSVSNSSQKANFSKLIFIFCGSLYLLVQSNLSLWVSVCPKLVLRPWECLSWPFGVCGTYCYIVIYTNCYCPKHKILLLAELFSWFFFLMDFQIYT